MKTNRFLALLFLIVLNSGTAWAQPQLIATIPASNQYPITFTDLAQRQIDVRFTEPVTITSTAGWTISVSGVNAIISPVVSGSGSDMLSFLITDQKTPATPGIEYSERLLVRVSYTSVTGNVKSVSLPIKPASSFANITAVNNTPFDCNIFNGIQAIGVTGAPQLCIPISPTLWGEYGVNLSAKNSIYFDATKITVFYRWHDSTNKIEYVPTVETPAGSGIYRATQTYTYPTGGNVCTYTPDMFPVLKVAPAWLSCSGGGRLQKQTFLAYSNDDDASGQLGMTPNIYYMCIGQSTANIIFNDATLLNCRLAVEPDQPNQKERRVRFTYGSTGSANGIPNISVGGIPVTDVNGNLISGEYVDPRNLGQGIVMPEPATGPTESTLPITFVSNGNEQVGDVFIISLEYWNPCNVYPFQPAVTTTARIEIVDGPIANAGPDLAICAGTSASLVGQRLRAATTSLWTTAGTGSFGNTANPVTTYIPSANDILAGSVILTLHAYAIGACPEDIDQMILTIDPLPAVPTITRTVGVDGFCDNNSTSLTLTSSLSPKGTYRWYRNATLTLFTTQSIVLNDYTQTGNYTVEVFGTTGNSCPSLSAQFPVNIYQMATVVTQPAITSTCGDDNMTTGNASFTVVTGGGAHSIRWQRKIGAGAWVDIIGGATPNDNCTYAGYNTATLNITSADIPMNGYLYRVKLTTTAPGSNCITYSNQATLTVYPVPSFTGPTNLAVCELAPGSFTSNVTIASGSITTYQWQRSNGTYSDINGATDGGIYTGFNTNTLNITSASASIDGDQYRLVVTTDHGCQMSSGAATINLNFLADITTQPQNTSICRGQSTTFTIIDDGNPAVTARQWQTYAGGIWNNLVNGGIYSGVTTANFTINNAPAGINGYQYRCILTTNGPCSIASSAAIITVLPLPAIGMTVSDPTICAGQTATISLANSVFGARYQLRLDADDSNVGASVLGTGGAITFNATPVVTTIYNVLATTIASGCPAEVTDKSTVSVNPLPTPVIGGETSPCLGFTKTYSTPLVALHNYSWAVNNGTISGPTTNNTVNIIWNVASGAGWVRVTETNTTTIPNCSFTTTNYNVTVNPSAPAAAGPITGSVNVCYGQSGVPYSITAVANASNYVWTVPGGTIATGAGTNAITVNFTLGAPDFSIQVYAENGCGVGATASKAIAIYPDLTIGTITGSTSPICYNANEGTLTANPSGGNGTYVYEWFKNGVTTGIATQTYAAGNLTANTNYYYKVTSCGQTKQSPTVNITVTPDLVIGTITGSTSPICYSTNEGTLTANPSAGDGTYAYEWFKGGVTTGITTSTYAAGVLTASASYYYRVTSCGQTKQSPTVNITVNPDLVIGVITGSTSPVCYNANAGTYTANPSGGNGTYVYEWFKNGVTTGISTSTYAAGILTASANYYYKVTSCGQTKQSPTVNITVTPDLVIGTITGSTSPICYNANEGTLTANPSGGNGTYVYEWFKNGVTTGIATQTYAAGLLTANTNYYYKVTSCGQTKQSPTVNITITPDLVIGTITGSTSPICYSTNEGTLTANPSAGDGTYAYEWFKGGVTTGITTSTYAAGILTANTNFYYKVTSCGQTKQSAAVNIIVNPDLVIGSISGSTSPICYNANAGTYTANPSGGNGTYTYEWFKNGVTTGITTQTYTAGVLTASASYYYKVTSCGQTKQSPTVNITVNVDLTIGTISGSTSPICYNTNEGTLTANPSGGDGTFTYEWFKNGVTTGINTSTYVAGNLTANANYYYKATSCGQTKQSPAINISVYPDLIQGAVTGVITPICSNTDEGTLTANPTGGDGIYIYEWFKDGVNTGINTQTYVAGVLTANASYYYKVTSCGQTKQSPSVSITVNPLPATANIVGEAQICDNSYNKVYQVNNTSGSTYSWTVPTGIVTKTFDAGLYFIMVDGKPGFSGTGNIQVIETITATGCAGAPKIFPLTVSPVSPGVVVSGTTDVCNGDAGVTYSVPDNAGSTYSWIVPPGASITSNPSLHEIQVTFTLALMGQSVSVFETVSGVCTTVHVPLTVNIHALPNIYTLSAPAYYCFGDPAGVTVTLSSSQGGVNYQLYKNAVTEGGFVAGTGAALTWTMTAGTYTVKATKNAAPFCNVMMNGNPSVEQNLPMLINSVIVTEPSCFGKTDGSIVINATGGYPPVTSLSYSINGGATYQSSATFTGIGAGTYNIIVKDTRNCTVTYAPQVVSQPPVLSISSLTVTNSIICFGNSDGKARVVATGGTPIGVTYLYQWYYDSGLLNPVIGQTFDEATGLTAGTYYVKVTDLKGCWVSGNITLTQPPTLTATSAVTSNYNGSQISCNGVSDGRIAVTAAGGTGALTYVLVEIPGNVTGAASGIFTGLTAGTYTVTVTDINLCSVTTLPVTITQPAAVAATAAVTSNYNGSQLSCNGASDGWVTVTASGGTGALSYLLNEIPLNITGSITGIFTGLPAGSYTVRVRDLNLCLVNTVAVTITAPLAVTATAAITSNYNGSEVSCNGSSDGTITVTAAGGTGALSYLLIQIPGNATGASSGIFTGVPAGTYTVRVTDLNGCNVTTLPVTIDNPLAIAAPIAITSNYNGSRISCFGASDGIITVTATGGTGALTHVLDQNPANVTGAASGVFTGLPAGTYTVTVTDLNLCSRTTSFVTLNNPAAVTAISAVTSNYNGSQVSCNGASDGRITVTASGGTGALTYLLVEMPLNVTGAATGIFTGVPAGTYTVKVSDLNSCNVTTAPLTITNPTPVIATAAVTSNYNGSDVSCFGASDGRITVTASGGTGALAYVLNEIPLNLTGLNTGIFTGVPAGSYTIKVTDKNGCNVITAAVTINNPPAVTATAAVTSNYNGSQVSCNGSSDGAITVTAGGGTGALNYGIVQLPGNLTGAATGLFTGIPAGTYTIRVTDVNGCNITTVAVTIINPPALTATGLVTSTYNGRHVSCNGASDGVITITAGGGTGLKTYVLDQNPGNVTGAGSGIFTGLNAGTYTVTVTDINGCTKTTSNIVVSNPPALTATSAVTSNYNGSQISCNGVSDGRIAVTATGGTGALTYLLIEIPGNVTGAASGIFTGLPAGSYTVTVTDINLCSVTTATVTIIQPLVVAATAAVTSNYNGSQLSCNGASDGRVTVTASGGTGALSYLLNEIPLNITGSIIGIFTGLPAGSYTVKVTDLNLCSLTTAPVTISPPTALSLTVNKLSNFNGRDISCFGASDGRAEAVVSGGTGSYSYNWYSDPAMTISIGQMTAIAINLPAGTYYVRVRDVNNCSISGNVILSQPIALNASITAQTNVDCYGNNTGSVTVDADALTGTSPYEYSINAGGSWQASGTFAALTANIYTVLVRDANGCIRLVPVNITQPTQLTATINLITNVSCNSGSNGAVLVTATAGSGTTPYSYSIDGGGSWQATGSFSGLTAGSYFVIVKDNNSCTITIPVVVTEPPAFVLNPTADVLLNCYGNTDGTGTYYATGGTGPFTYAFVFNDAGAVFATPGFNSQTILNAGAGVVTVRATDSKGCTAQATITFTQPADLTPGVISGNQVVCYGANPAPFTATAPTGGPTTGYIYQWQVSSSSGGTFNNIGGATNPIFDPPAGVTGTLFYRRMVTSGTCAPVYSNVIEVLVNPLPVAMLTGGETICPAQSSILKVTMPVGTGPFQVDIENYPGVTISGYVSGTNIPVTPAVTTTYKLLRVRDANGCEVLFPSANLSGTATVIVSTVPSIATFTPSPAVCEFTLATYKVTTNGTNPTYQWYVDDNLGAGFISIVDGGTYFGAQTPTLQIFNSVRGMNGYIYHVVVSGCSTNVTSADAVFTVNTAPELTLHPSDSTVCLGNNATMEADATGTSVTWQWWVNKGGPFVLVTDDANFSGSATKTLTITNALATFNNWIFRAKATGICGVPAFTNFGRLLVINPPSVTLQPVAKVICENGNTSFLGNGTGYSGGLQWQVSTNGGGSWINISDDATYVGSGTNQLSIMDAPVTLNGNQYHLSLIGSCKTVNTNDVLLTVNPNPVVSFAADINACGAVPLVINGNPTGGSGTWASHLWTGDIGPLNNYFVQSPTFNSQIAGSYTLNYKVKDSNGCYGNDDVIVIVDSPSADFNQDINNGCTPLIVTFTKDMTGITKFWWDFDDGSPVDSVTASPLHQFTNTNPSTIGYYNVTLTVRSPGGCLDTFTSMVTVYPAIDATFTSSTNIVCSGNPIVFTSLPGASKYFWEYGDGVSGYATNTTSHLYTNFTTAPVVLQVKLTTTSFYNCTNVKTFDITVMPVPLPQFTALPVSQIYNAAGNPVTFTNTTNPGTWNWLWKFGDGATSAVQNPSHTYATLGDFIVTLVVNNANCSDSIKHTVRVLPIPPVANFDSIPSECSPLAITINNTSLNTETPGTTYRWDFGDGSTSTAKNPTYTWFDPGIYRVELVVTGPGGVSSKSQVVNAYPSPKAYFEVAPSFVFVNDEKVRGFNLSQGADNYLWEFGDGDTSKIKEPFHKYMEPGVFDITLWAYSNNGCFDKYVLSPGVTVEPAGEVRFSTVFTPNKDGPIERTDLPTGGIEIDQFFFPPIREKVINYKLQIFNRLGVLIFESHNINIPWNGYYKGKLCPQGVYVWYVEGKYANGQPFKKVGDVTLLH